MTVSLNLLGGGIAEDNSAADCPFAVRLCVFLLAVTFAVVLYEYYIFDGLYKKRIAAEAELRAAKNEMSVLNAKFGDVEARLKGVEKMLDFMLGDVRAGEILSLLTFCAVEGAVVERLEVTAEGMTLFGKAKNERGISDLYKALVSSSFFASVGKLCSVSDVDSGFNFTIQCGAADALDIGGADGR